MTDPTHESTDNFSHLDPSRAQAVRWFVRNGGEYDYEASATSEFEAVILHDVEFFIGSPSIDGIVSIETDGDEVYYVDKGLEIAALVVLDSHLDLDSLNDLVEPLRPITERTENTSIEIEEDISGRNVWVVSRFTEEQLSADTFNSLMQEYLVIVDKVSELIRS